jgi:putrescine transport system substrate-binding protein
MVHVYGWYDHIPEEVIKQFEQETGISVKFDLIDSNELLQAKLLLGNTGYDVVFPTAYPYVALQIPAKLYHPIDHTKLKNFHYIDPQYLRFLEFADPGNKYAIPSTWGLVVFGYNEDMIKGRVPEQYLDSWAMLYDPAIVSKFAQCGVAFLEDATDVFYTNYLYWGIDINNGSLKILKQVTTHLKTLRPYIKKFDINLSSEQLASGEICIAQQWSSNLVKALSEYAHLKNRPNIKIVFPKEGSLIWIDCMTIPADAPHLGNAYKFIDFLLRPDISAKITNAYYLRTTTKEKDILQYVDPKIKSNPIIFPDASVLRKAKVASPPSLQFFRKMTRAFLDVLSVH